MNNVLAPSDEGAVIGNPLPMTEGEITQLSFNDTASDEQVLKLRFCPSVCFDGVVNHLTYTLEILIDPEIGKPQFP